MKDQDGRGMHEFTRRDFLKGTAYGTLGIALGLGGLDDTVSAGEGDTPFAASNPTSSVVLVRDAAAVNENHEVNAEVVARMFDVAVKALAGKEDVANFWRSVAGKDDTLGIKFSRCSWNRVPTEQAVIDAVTARVSGYGVSKKRIHAADYGLPVDRCTRLINISSIKVHAATGIAAAIKNYINFTGKESSYHHQGSAKLGEAWLLPHVKDKTRLIVIDALRPYFGPGPQVNPLYRWDYKGIMVTTDPVAADVVCLRLSQRKRDLFKKESWPINPPPLSIAAADTEYGLGTSDPSKIKLVKVGWEKDILI